MRLATITNWAYGVTVLLTAVSGGAMLLASDAQEKERVAVALRHGLDQATAKLDLELALTSERVRSFVGSGSSEKLADYRREMAAEVTAEARTRQLRDIGAGDDELHALSQALEYADKARTSQAAAVAAMAGGDAAQARAILYAPDYEINLERAIAAIERFQYRLDERTGSEVAQAEQRARLWQGASEALLAVTGGLFLLVLFFVFRQRVLRPVVRLSDVVSRLAQQDYDIDLPAHQHVDEIGDMAEAIRVFRENGLERERLERERDADRAVRDLLARMTQRMQGTSTLDDLVQVIRCLLPQVAPGYAGRIYLLDRQRNAMVEAGFWGTPQHSGHEMSPAACWGLQRGAAHRPAGSAVDVPCMHLASAVEAQLDTICIPLIAQRETLGLLYLEPADGRAADSVAETYLRMLAENVGLALANLRLRDALRDLAMADPLTGLSNRRALDAVLARELTDAERGNRPVACLMVDVDHFKRFNDEYGHEAGDAVLRAVGGALKSCVRDTDHVFRYGGEEFLILMPGSSIAQAVGRAEQIRIRISALRLSHSGFDLGRVTASVGAAAAPSPCSFDRLVGAADEALYAAKGAGRDRVVAAPADDSRSVARAC